jgi:hypothetical protein
MKIVQQPWHALSPQEAMTALNSDPSGLAADEAARRLLELGANEHSENIFAMKSVCTFYKLPHCF